MLSYDMELVMIYKISPYPFCLSKDRKTIPKRGIERENFFKVPCLHREKSGFPFDRE
jgi:hypothetical protein